MPNPRPFFTARSLTSLIIVPFTLAAAAAISFESTVRPAMASSCGTSDFWILERGAVQGAPASWPRDGHLMAGWLQLEEPGSVVSLRFSE